MLPDRHGCRLLIVSPREFQWAPTLEGECYALTMRASFGVTPTSTGFNGHPPLGVNATRYVGRIQREIQRSFKGHPPLGVNATGKQ